MKRICLTIAFLLLCGPSAYAQFPTALDTDATLLHAYNLASGTLSAMISSGVSAIPVSGNNFGNNMVINIGSEFIFCPTYSDISHSFSNCTRGYDSSVAASHTANDAVRGFIIAAHHNVLATALKNVETALGVNLANVARTNAATTYQAYLHDFGLATLKLPTAAGLAETANGRIGYDSTANAYKFGFNGASRIMASLSGAFADNDCPKYSAAVQALVTAGAACNTGGGGGTATSAQVVSVAWTGTGSGCGTGCATFTATSNTSTLFVLANTLQGNLTTFNGNTISGLTGGQVVTLVFTEDAVGGHTVSMPASFSQACQVSTIPNATTKIQFIWDGTNGQLITCTATAGPSILVETAMPSGNPTPGTEFLVADSTSGILRTKNIQGAIYAVERELNSGNIRMAGGMNAPDTAATSTGISALWNAGTNCNTVTNALLMNGNCAAPGTGGGATSVVVPLPLYGQKLAAGGILPIGWHGGTDASSYSVTTLGNATNMSLYCDDPLTGGGLCWIDWTQTDATTRYVIAYTAIPAGWTSGTVSMSMTFQGGGSAITVQWNVRLGCAKAGNYGNWTTPQNFSAQAMTGFTVYTLTLSGLTMPTSCVAGDMLRVQLRRTDTAGRALLSGSVLTFAIP